MTYKELVEKRKKYKIGIEGLLNPNDNIETKIYDKGCYLDPWAKWHKSVPADIMVVGQDWGSVKYYLKNSGGDNEKILLALI
jgi:hypothetical protein